MLVDDLRPQFLGQLPAARILHVGHHHFRAFAGEQPHRCLANAACAAGDDGYLVVQTSHGLSPQ